METAQTFKLRSIVRNAGFEKQQGYRVVEIMTLMMLLPFLLVKSVHSLYVSDFKRITEMKKDTIYRLKNNELVPWRSILYGVVKGFQTLTNPQKTVAPNSAFVVDDTTDSRVGSKIEKVSFVYDHVAGQKGSKLGFKYLMLGWLV